MTGAANLTPRLIDNRAGLARFKRRIGTQPEFREAMLRAMRSRHRPGLHDYSTLSDEDWTIALVDAWAMVCDILTFYNERLNHEAYLRSATEVFSVEALAELVDYKLSPATAAETHLAFTADEDGPAHRLVTVPARLGVKSIPDDDQQPQVFETLDEMRVKPAWNALLPLRSWPQVVDRGDDGFLINPAAAAVSEGTRILLLGENGEPERRPDNSGYMHRVSRVTPLSTGQTELSFIALSGSAQMPDLPTHDSLLLPEAPTEATLRMSDAAAMLVAMEGQSWPRATVIDGAAHVAFDRQDLGTTLRAAPRVETGLQPVMLTQGCRLFGHNTLSERGDITITAPSYIGTSSFYDGDDDPLPPDKIALYLDRAYEGIAEGMIVVIRGENYLGDPLEAWTRIEAAETTSVEAYGMSGEVTRITVPRTWQGSIYVPNLILRTCALFTLPKSLPLADLPLSDNIQGSTLLLDRPDVDLAPGQTLYLTGERADLPGVIRSERITLRDVAVNGTTGLITFEPALTGPYLRHSVTLNANVAKATHGETVEEVLGSGDATKHFQSFTLKDGPLTYLSAETETGNASTLEVFVDGVQWEEVRDFGDAAPGARVFVLTTLSDGKSRVTFGNGLMGATLPTGENNITARYRKGAGASGRLRAGQLSLMMSKPRILSAVTNPLPSAGGSDGESLETARMNAPQKMMTMGRVVSLTDFADYARAFSGVTKALASWSWVGGAQGVFLTIAGETPDPLPLDSGVLPNLAASIVASAPEGTRVTVGNLRVARFSLHANLRIDPAYVAKTGSSDEVLAAARATLRSGFAYEHRAIGAPVRASDVIAKLQAVPGVVAVDLDHLYRTDMPAARHQVLLADMPRRGSYGPQEGAEILILTDDPVELGEF